MYPRQERGYQSKLNITTPSGRLGHYQDHNYHRQQSRDALVAEKRGGYALTGGNDQIFPVPAPQPVRAVAGHPWSILGIPTNLVLPLPTSRFDPPPTPPVPIPPLPTSRFNPPPTPLPVAGVNVPAAATTRSELYNTSIPPLPTSKFNPPPTPLSGVSAGAGASATTLSESNRTSIPPIPTSRFNPPPTPLLGIGSSAAASATTLSGIIPSSMPPMPTSKFNPPPTPLPTFEPLASLASLPLPTSKFNPPPTPTPAGGANGAAAATILSGSVPPLIPPMPASRFNPPPTPLAASGFGRRTLPLPVSKFNPPPTPFVEPVSGNIRSPSPMDWSPTAPAPGPASQKPSAHAAGAFQHGRNQFSAFGQPSLPNDFPGTSNGSADGNPVDDGDDSDAEEDVRGESNLDRLIKRLSRGPAGIPVTRADFLLFLQTHEDAAALIYNKKVKPERKLYLKKPRAEKDKVLSAFVRALTARCMGGRKPGQRLQNNHFPHPDDLKQYLRTKDDSLGPNIDNLKLDVGLEGASSAWNKRAAVLFAERFSTIYDPSRQRWTTGEIERAFLVHARSLRKTVVKGWKADNEDSYDVEEVARIARRRARAYNEYHRRLDGWRMYASEKVVEDHLDLWTSINYDGFISDSHTDEDEFGTDSFRRARHYYRNPELDAYFRLPALLQLSTHYQDNGRKTIGRLPHIRNRNKPLITFDKRPPCGLPKNFYNPAYLSDLTAQERKSLKMGPPLKTEFPAYLIQHASRFEKVRSAEDVPQRKAGKWIAPTLAHLVAPNDIHGVVHSDGAGPCT